MSRTTFTSKEDAVIRSLRPTHTIEQIACVLSNSSILFTPRQVRARIEKLRLPRMPLKRSKESIAKAVATRALRKDAPRAPIYSREGWPRAARDPEAAMFEAMRGRVYGRPLVSSNIAVNGAKLARSAMQGSTGSAAALCVEG